MITDTLPEFSQAGWPAARIIRELRPMAAETCAEISQLLGYRGR